MPLDPVEAFEVQRPRLLYLAYRMLGSRHEAEDIVQESWLRWRNADQDAVQEPAAWLTRVVSRLCLDHMKSARVRRETYPGIWLPDPLLEPEDDDLRADNLTRTLMMALDRLSPLERAAFLLHDIFGERLDEVAATI
ncbi:MAG: sigma-70 family RNA polymerase sigma factor, partial [Pigmentiphaga sp.]